MFVFYFHVYMRIRDVISFYTHCVDFDEINQFDFKKIYLLFEKISTRYHIQSTDLAHLY